MISRETVKLLTLIGLIGGPTALVSVEVNYPYGIVGAFVFGLLAFATAKICASRKGLCVALSAALGILLTVGLHYLSLREIIVDNRSGQRITSIFLSATNGNQAFPVGGIPRGTVAALRFYDLAFDGQLDVVDGKLADGTLLTPSSMPIRATETRRRIRVIVGSDGSVSRAYK